MLVAEREEMKWQKYISLNIVLFLSVAVVCLSLTFYDNLAGSHGFSPIDYDIA